MTSNYYVDGVLITDIAWQAGTLIDLSNVKQYYPNFPKGRDTLPIAACMDFGYKRNGVDIASFYRAPQSQSNVASTPTIDLTSATNRKYKHVAGLIYAGGGGGGGGGGRGWNGGSYNDASPGSAGGYGGAGWIRYAEITNYESLYCVIGSGGTGGVDGNDANTPSQERRTGGDGAYGNAGNDSRIRGTKIGASTFTPLCAANGGDGGYGGRGGRSNTDYNTINDGTGSVGSGSTGTNLESGSATPENIDTDTYYSSGTYGVPGNGGTGRGLGGNNFGNDGTDGIGWIWLLYEKD
jgi:hypothetical protein